MRISLLLPALSLLSLHAQEASLIAHWSFDRPETDKAVITDSVSNQEDPIEGKFRFMPGVEGQALRFDGYTTVIDRPAATAPQLQNVFTISAWVAQAAYPWNQCPIISQANPEQKTGYRLMLGTRGELILEAGTGVEWQSLASEDWAIPLRTWMHVAATYDPQSGMKLYINGKPVASQKASATMKPATGMDLRIGSLHEPTKPSHIHREWGTLPTWWTMDGQLDDLKIHNRALTGNEISKLAQSYGELGEPEMPARRLPSGPKGPKRFGASYTQLKFYEQWDDLWRVGDDPDVVVQFDESPVRLVFWRGTRYGPAWVSENDLWMSDQSVEAWDHDKENAAGCHEHMQDRHCRYSHVRIIESNPARVVVHWRYAPVSAIQRLWRPDPRTGKACWVDEYYTIYPDATWSRKASWTTGTLGHPRQFQESLVLNHPGQYYHDIVHNPYVHMAKLDGTIGNCGFTDLKPGESRKKAWTEDYILQRYNFKSEHKPFIIFQEGNSMWLREEGSYQPEKAIGCNHWPVGQAACDGRTQQAADRAGHVMGFPISTPPVHTTGNRSWWTGFYGMGTQSVETLIEMARAFNDPPSLTLKSEGYDNLGFDPGQRAWVIENNKQPGRPLKFVLNADKKQLLYNPAFVIKNAGDTPVTLKINGEMIAFDKDHRMGYRHHLDSTDLILWIKSSGQDTLELELLPQTDS